MPLCLALLALSWRPPLSPAGRPSAARACADDLDRQIARERAAVEELRRSVSELERSLQSQRDAMRAAPPPPHDAPPQAAAAAAAADSEVFESFVAEVERGGLAVGDELRGVLRAAWDEAVALQSREVAWLKKSVTAMASLEGALDAPGPEVDVSGDIAKATALMEDAPDLGEYSSLPQRIYNFYRNLEPGEISGAMDRLASGEESASGVFSAQLKLLRDHEAAGCVEYRRFAEALSFRANGTLAAAAGGMRVPYDPLVTVITRLLIKRGEQADDKDDEADALLASSPLLRRYVDLAKPALEGRKFTAVGAFLFVVSLTCVEQSTLECAAVYVYARALAAANVKRLAFCAGTSPPEDVDALVVQRELAYGGEDFGSIVFTASALSVIGVLLSGFLGWQVLSFVLSPLFGSQ